MLCFLAISEGRTFLHMAKSRVFSGMRPSGNLHVGNWLGALTNMVELQDNYECIYAAVDVHALTTDDGGSPETLHENIFEMVLDWLAAGIDPKKSMVFVQSSVPEVMILHTLLSMMTPLGWLLRVPTFKDKVRQMEATEESVGYGLVGYPVLMTSDIILYKADTVPVGEDQVPHIELAREIVRRFNFRYGQTFPEPQAKLTEVPLVVGLDGQAKMSKTLGNHVELAASPEETKKKILTAFTDPERLRKNDPGRPWVCNVYALHKYFTQDQTEDIYQQCTQGTRGCVECKGILADGVNAKLTELRERRRGLQRDAGYVEDVLLEGARRASDIAKATLQEVQEKMGLSSAWLKRNSDS
jgi:tryptophanyl-tRNA synthetase